MELAGRGQEQEIRTRVTEVLRREFLPEFLNRIDEVIFFHPLGRAEIREIVDLQLAHLEAAARGRGI